MLKVCHFLSGDRWAGAEVMAFHLLRGFRAEGEVEVSAVLFNEGRLAEELRGAGVPVTVLKERHRSFIALALEARRLVGEGSFDLLHSHRYKENILVYLAACAQRHRPHLVATQHGLPEPTSRRATLNSFIYRVNLHLMASHFDGVAVVSRNIEEHFVGDLGFSASRVRVIHNGLRLPLVPEVGWAAELIVGSAGRLFPVKDYPLMVEIAREVRAQEPSVGFALAGEGPERGRIEDLCGRYRLGDSFELCGEVREMTAFYRRLGLYLNTSVHEGVPMSVLEAMAHGLPVVAPKVGGFIEIVADGTDGFLIEGRDPRSFAEKCLLLARDRQRCETMGKAARQKVAARFSLEAMVGAYGRLYREVAGNRG
jgi:glycosyltransferase involved in cell wall biosynthesis